MDLDLTADQKDFLATTEKFLDRRLARSAIPGPDQAHQGSDRDWWPAAAELGWTALLVPEQDGGGRIGDSGLLDLILVAEAVGARAAPGPLIPVNVLLSALVATDPGARAANLDKAVEGLLSGELIGSWAVYEPGQEWAPDEPATQATKHAGGWELNGVKDRVEAALDSDLLLVTAQTPEGPGQFLVPAQTPGVSVVGCPGLDLTRRFGQVRLDQVRLEPDARILAPGGDAAAIGQQTRIALVLQTADTCGILERVFSMTVQWAFDRYSFGRPLASYQALKHRFADMRTWLEGCRAIAVAAARAVAQDRPDAPELVSAAAAYVGDRSLDIIQDCVQLHGGIGLTWEHELHLYLRRATVNRSLYGTPRQHRRHLAAIAMR